MMALCLICEKEVVEYIHMEYDFALCRECHSRMFPLLVKQAVLGNTANLLHEARYATVEKDKK